MMTILFITMCKTDRVKRYTSYESPSGFQHILERDYFVPNDSLDNVFLSNQWFDGFVFTWLL